MGGAMRSGWLWLGAMGCAWVSPSDEADALLRAEPLDVVLVDAPEAWTACREAAFVLEVDAGLDGRSVEVTPLVDGIAGEPQSVAVEQALASIVVPTTSWAAGPREVRFAVGLEGGPRSFVEVGELPDATPYGYIDADGDGSPGDELAVDCDGTLFEAPADCDDTEPGAYPGGPEIVADGVDGDCDGMELCYVDGDGDGFAGESTASVGGSLACGPAGLFEVAEDCDDGDAAIAPGAAERCDGVDNDCDGQPGADELDGDGDGYLACEAVGAALGGDCNDADAAVFPGAPELVANGVDNDCDGLELCYVDADRDAFGDGALQEPSGDLSCAAPGLSTSGTDCDDLRADVYPGAPEVCDGVLQDCNATEELPNDPIGLQFGDGPVAPVADLPQAIDQVAGALDATLHVCGAFGDVASRYVLDDPVTIQGHGDAVGAGSLDVEDTVTLRNLSWVPGPGTQPSLLYGGALYVGDGQVTAVDVDIDCTGTAYQVSAGGAVFVSVNGSLIGDGLSIHGCFANTGGAIDNRGELVLVGGSLYENAANRGGAIYSVLGFSMDGVEVHGNTADIDGGAIHLTNAPSDTTLTGVLFRDNAHTSTGAVNLSVNDSPVVLVDVRFEPVAATSASQLAVRTRGALTATRMEIVPSSPTESAIDLRTYDPPTGTHAFSCFDCTFEVDTLLRRFLADDTNVEYQETLSGTYDEVECLPGTGGCTTNP